MSPINSPYEANVPRAPSLSHAFSRSIVRTGAGYRSLTGKAAAGRALQRMQFDRVVPVRCAATPASYYYERRCCGCAYRSGRPSSAWWRGKARLYASERAAAAAAARASTPGRAAGLDGACAQSPHTEASMHAGAPQLASAPPAPRIKKDSPRGSGRREPGRRPPPPKSVEASGRQVAGHHLTAGGGARRLYCMPRLAGKDERPRRPAKAPANPGTAGQSLPSAG